MWRIWDCITTVLAALALATCADAFVVQGKSELGRPVSRAAVCSARGLHGLRMQEEEDAVNREQRRMMKKSEKRRLLQNIADAKSIGRTSPQEASEVTDDKLAASASGLGMMPPNTSANRPKTMEDLRKESLSVTDAARRAVAKAEEFNTQKPELLGYEEMKQVDPSVLASIESFLLGSVLLAGGSWLLAGLGVAYDAYMVASKKELPAGFDSVLSNYVYPFLTYGIVAVFLLSGLLGVLQFYKFEGGKTGASGTASKLNEARRLTDASKRRKERGGG